MASYTNQKPNILNTRYDGLSLADLNRDPSEPLHPRTPRKRNHHNSKPGVFSALHELPGSIQVLAAIGLTALTAQVAFGGPAKMGRVLEDHFGNVGALYEDKPAAPITVHLTNAGPEH